MLNNQTGLKRLIFAHAAAGRELPQINEYTVTGNPAEFNTNLARSLQSFEIPFSPVQSGSGDPSPSNVRPISGWAGLTINANNNLIMVEWQSVAGVIYGGKLDAVSGLMTVEWGIIDLGTIDWSLEQSRADRQIWRTDLDNIEPAANGDDLIHGISTIFKRAAQSTTWVPGMISSGTASGGKRVYVVVDPYSYETTQEIQAGLSGIPLVYELETPQTIHLSPVEVKTIVGQNSISASNNGTNTIKYLKRG